MRKRLLTTLYFMTFILFSAGCQPDASQAGNNLDDNLTQEAASQELVSTENDVTLTIEKEKYSTAVEEIAVEIKNDSQSEYMTGTHVFLEKKADDIWYLLPMKGNSVTDAGLIHRPGEVTPMIFEVESLKYELTPGQYRATVNKLGIPFEVLE